MTLIFYIFISTRENPAGRFRSRQSSPWLCPVTSYDHLELLACYIGYTAYLTGTVFDK